MITSTPATDLPFQQQPKSNPKPRTRVMRTQGQWKALLEEFNTSGLTKIAFCNTRRIATRSLYRWQQLLAGQAGVTDFVDVSEPLSREPVPAPSQARIWLCTVPTDMRKSCNGLSALVKNRLQGNPLSGELFVFVNRRQNQMKVLCFDRSGYCIGSRKLEQSQFVVRSAPDGKRQLNWTQLK